MARELKAKVKIEADTKQARSSLGKLDKSLDKTTKTTGGLGGAFSKFTVGLAAAGIGIAAFTSFLRSAFAAAKEQELAIAALDAQLKGLGAASIGVSQALQAQASALQNVSLEGDETIIKAQATIAIFTKEEEEIKALTAAALDLSAALGLSLESSAQLLGKTLGSATNALSRYGVAVEGAVGSTERFSSLMEGLSKFTGAAEASVNTFAGQVDLLSRNLFDAAENMAEVITKNDDLLAALKRSNKELARLNKVVDEAPGFWSKVGAALGSFITTLKTSRISMIGFTATTLELREETARLAQEEEAAAAAAAILEAAQKRANQTTEEWLASTAELRKEMQKLGLVDIPDNTQAISDNDEAVRKVTASYDAGLLSQGRYLDEIERLRIATLDLQESHLRVAAVITDAEIPARDSAVESIAQEVAALARLNEAKQRDIDKTREQAAAEARAADQRDQRNAGDSFAQVGGGVFSVSGVTAIGGVNGRVIGGRSSQNIEEARSDG